MLNNIKKQLKPKKLYLHIGFHKTGTTTIQNFLRINSELIEQKDYLYPVSGRKYHAHFQLGWGLTPAHVSYNRLFPQMDKLWGELAQEISAKSFSNIILSAEAFDLVNEHLPKLKEYLARYETKIIIYLRRQDHLIQSQYGQKIIKPSVKETRSIDDFIKNLLENDILVHYSKLLDRWEQFFGKENLIVRIYEKEQLPDGLVADFLNAVGLTLTQEYLISDRDNKSLHPDVLEFIRLSNQLPLDLDTSNKLRLECVEMSKQLSSRSYFDPHSLLSPQQRIELINHYEESNRYVAQKYLGREDGRLFYEPLPDSNDLWRPYSGLSTEKALQIMVQLWASQQKQISAFNHLASQQKENLPKNDLFNKIKSLGINPLSKIKKAVLGIIE
jgi:hypothetical protein